ncbi:MAG: ATP-binding protein [Bryobacteraceae bacterium]|nr:ATP-binding protein [Bryobacteraceae bacterium]
MRRPRILNVDDRDLNRYLRSEALRESDYEIIEASRGREALQKAVSESPDLVLLDVHLPDVSGLEVCRLLKSDQRTSGIKVLQISASAVEFTDAVIGLDIGADDYLVEPVEPELLRAKIRSLLRLREAEQSLRRSNDDLKQFAYAASHDLQEPIRVLSAYSELLGRRYASQLDETGTLYLKYIVEGAQRMSRLVSDLLDYSRLSADMDQDPQLVSVENVLNRVLQTLKAPIDQSQTAITWDPLPQIEGNETRLTQVFTNLIGNAIKYGRPGIPPEVHIAVQARGPEWLFCVRDNGIGFDAEYAESIFGVFRRLHDRTVPGNGIGLAICKSVVERSGGRIWAEAIPGEGATFHFTWPLARAIAAAP